MADRLTNQILTNLEKYVSGSIRDVEATLYADSNVPLIDLGNGTYSIAITSIDGINLVSGAGQRLFFAQQTTKSQIGVYGIISAVGVTPLIVQLATDFTNDNLFNNTRVQIQQGTNYAGNFYLCSGIGNTKSVAQTDQALDNLQVAVSTLQTNFTNLNFSNIGGQISPSQVPTLNQNTTGTASNITATSNSTLTTLSALSLPYSQLSGTVPTWNQNTTGNSATATNMQGGLANQINYQTGANTTGFITTANNSVLVTNGSGVPSWATTLPTVSGINLTNLSGANITTNSIPLTAISQATANTYLGNNTGAIGNITVNNAGSLTELTSSVLTISGTNALLNNATITVKQANTSQGGYLSNTDWNTFNSKLSSIGDGSITNAKLNTMATLTIKGNNTGATGSPLDLSVLQVNTMLGINTNTQYVTPNGSDSNNGFTPNTGVATLGQALTNMGNVAGTIVVYPKVGGYSETTTITAQNITIMGLTKNQAVQFTNPITFAHTASNIQVSDIGFTTLIHNNAGGLYLRGGSVTTSLTKSGAGYLEARGVDLQATSTTVSITGSGSITFTDSTVMGTTTINNAAAVVSIMNCLNSKAITLTAGVLGVSNTTVYSASAGANAISVASGGVLYATNSTMMVTGTTTPALINVASGGFYSIDNCIYSASSTLSGTLLTRTAIFDAIKLLTPLPVASGGTGQTTATGITSILDNFVGDSGSGGTKGLVPAPAGGDGAAGKFLNANGGWSVPSGSSNSSTYYRSYNTAATNGVFVQTITATGTVNWLTVANTTQRLTVNNNVFQNGGFTQTASNITIPTTGVYTITLNLTPAVTGTNREVWVQLVKTTSGTSTVINCSAEYNGGAGNNGFVALSYTGSFAINDIIDFRIDTPAGTSPSIGISAYSIFISAVSVPSTTATSTPTANTVSQWDNNKNFNANNYQSDSLPVVSSATVVNLTVASPRVISVTGTSNQNILLPDPATLKYGHTVIIENGSTGIINVGDNLANYFISILPNKLNTFTLSNTGTWGYDRTVTGFVALNTVMCIGDLFFQLTVTGGKGMTIRPQNANIVAQAVGETFYGVNQTYYNSTNNNASLPTASYNSALPWTGTTTNNNTLKQDIYDVTNGKTYSFFAQFRASSCTISAEIKNT